MFIGKTDPKYGIESASGTARFPLTVLRYPSSAAMPPQPMTFLQKKLWLAWQKFRFLRLPPERRVRLEVEQDGRHLTFLLVSLYEAGYGVQVVNSPWVFRELMLLQKSAPIPFVIGGKEREVGISISDKFGFNHGGHREHGGGKRVLLDYDYFSGLTTKKHEYSRIEAEQTGLRLASQANASEPDSLASKLAHAPVSESLIRSADGPTSSPATTDSPLVTAPEAHALDARPSALDSSVPVTSHSPPATALRAPYFMHPSVYHRGLHKSRLLTRHSPQRRRRFRIGFFGTHDRKFYTRLYHFLGMNRFQILEVFLKRFDDRMTQVSGAPEQWPDSEIVVSIDDLGGDRQGKSFLSQENYFAALRECDFVLSPPGWCMPVSHNLIEAMFCGAIPITNGGQFMAQPLEDGRNCLGFSGEAAFIAAIEKALSMSDQEIEKKRKEVLEYYLKYLDAVSFGKQFGNTSFDFLTVNAEEKSVFLKHTKA